MKAQADAGAVVVELAVCAAAFLVLVLFLIDLSRIFIDCLALHNAARAAARHVAVSAPAYLSDVNGVPGCASLVIAEAAARRLPVQWSTPAIATTVVTAGGKRRLQTTLSVPLTLQFLGSIPLPITYSVQHTIPLENQNACL